MRVLGISGRLRRDSHNTAALRHAVALFEAEGAKFELYDGLKQIPPYDEDDDVENGPEAVARLRGAVAETDPLFFLTPEYNSPITRVLKNAIDCLSSPKAARVLMKKPAAVIGARKGMFGAV